MGQQTWGTGERNSPSVYERLEWQLNEIRAASIAGGSSPAVEALLADLLAATQAIAPTAGIETKYATATAATTGVNIGDRLRRVAVIQPGPPIVITTSWFNLSTGQVAPLSVAPTNPDYDDDGIEAALNVIYSQIQVLDGRLGTLTNLSCLGRTDVDTAFGLNAVSAVHNFNDYRNCSVIFNVAGITAMETVVVQMEHQAAAAGLWGVLGSPQTFSLGVNSIRFGPHAAANLRLRLLSCSNPANTTAVVSTAEWRLGR